MISSRLEYKEEEHLPRRKAPLPMWTSPTLVKAAHADSEEHGVKKSSKRILEDTEGKRRTDAGAQTHETEEEEGMQESKKEEKKSSSTQNEGRDVDLEPPPPPPAGSCSNSSTSETPPGPRPGSDIETTEEEDASHNWVELSVGNLLCNSCLDPCT